ncbi:BCCT family transporter [Bacillus sp. EKM417B]|nr:BCCT family transporter [Bacillus sp. EKM420B]KAF6605640.1 BCCT family transporter [Bacillus sp. EKM417B]
MSPNSLQKIPTTAQGYITNRFAWYYLLDVSLFVAFCIIFSPIGKNKLRKPAKKLNFILLSWFTMLFGADMDISRVF